MSDTISVLWIDDSDRTEDKKNLDSEWLNIEWVHPGDFSPKLQQYESDKTAPDLFLIDFYLGLIPNRKGEKYPNHGLAPNALTRDKYPEHPIYLVTEEETENGDARLSTWAQAAECTFDNILTLKEVQRKGKDTLYYDALDYKTIRTKTARGEIQALFDLVKAPASETERIRLVLPDELKYGLMPANSTNTEGNTISFARWVHGSLLTSPGLLYDQLHAATLLGFNLEGFEKISSEFKDALYKGVFSIASEPRWWVSTINDILFSTEKAQEIESSDPRVVSTTVFSIPEEERSKCVVCEDFLPETVGTNLDNPREVGPVHIKCSMPDINKTRQLYFDMPRVFQRS